MNTYTLKTYKTALTNFVKTDMKQAETLQAVLVLGFEQVLKVDADGNLNGNLGVLSDVVNATGTMRNKLTKVVTAYIQDHIKHIVWDKEGKRYTKIKDKTAKIEGEYPTYPYFNHAEMDKQGHQAPTFDENKRLDSFFQQRNKAVNGGTLKGDDAKLIEQLLAYANALKEAQKVDENRVIGEPEAIDLKEVA